MLVCRSVESRVRVLTCNVHQPHRTVSTTRKIVEYVTRRLKGSVLSIVVLGSDGAYKYNFPDDLSYMIIAGCQQ